METLFEAMADAIWEEIQPLVVEEAQSGPLAERLEALIVSRCLLFEKVSPYFRASIAHRKRSTFVREQHHRDAKHFLRDLKNWLPEIETAAPDVADAIEMALSFEAWDRLRSGQKLSAKRAMNAIRHLVKPLALSELSTR